SLPVLEDLAVFDEDVAASLQEILLVNATPLDLLADVEAVLGVDEGDVVHQEDVGLGDARQVLGDRVHRRLAVAPPVERPGAADGAVPRTTAGELGRGTRIEYAEEVASPVARQITRGREAVEVLEQRGGRAGACARHRPGHGIEARVTERLDHTRRGDLALAAHDAIEHATGMLDQLFGDERCAVTAREEERPGPATARGHGQVQHLGDVGQVVQRKADGARLEGVQRTGVVTMAEDLEVEDPDLMASGEQRLGHTLEPERLELEEYL